MVKGNLSKYIYLDSSVNTLNQHTQVLCPSHPFMTQGNEKMSLTLVSFGMKRSFYHLNNTNNIFYIFVGNVYFEVVIPPGTYESFSGNGSLSEAIQTAITTTITNSNPLQATITAAVVTYNANTRKFTFDFTMTQAHANTQVQLRCFLVKTGTLPLNVSQQGGYSDSFIILGMKPIRDLNTVFNCADATSTKILVSKSPASLSSNDAIYLHMNATETSAYESSGFNAHIVDTLRLHESSIFARIPYDDSVYDSLHEYIQYEDPGSDLYQNFLSRKIIDKLDFKVTDARGRNLADYNPTQADDGLMQFHLVLRWDLFAAQISPQKMHPPDFSHPPVA